MKLRQYFDLPGSMTQAAMARALGIDGSQFGQWVREQNGRRPCPHYCMRIEEITRGLVTCEELHTDAGWYRIHFKGFVWPHHPGGYPMMDPAIQAI